MAGRDVISEKIAKMIDEENKDPDEAAAIAYSMARRGELGPAARQTVPQRPRRKE